MNRAGVALIAGGVAVLAVAIRGRPDPAGPLCTSPPGAYPALPAGWQPYRGRVTPTAAAEARASLSMPMGASRTFVDEDGQLVGVLLTWHCHEPEEGVTPVGWHKGATLYRIG
jgi:hypothetical protein